MRQVWKICLQLVTMTTSGLQIYLNQLLSFSWQLLRRYGVSDWGIAVTTVLLLRSGVWTRISCFERGTGPLIRYVSKHNWHVRVHLLRSKHTERVNAYGIQNAALGKVWLPVKTGLRDFLTSPLSICADLSVPVSPLFAQLGSTRIVVHSQCPMSTFH